MTFFKLSTGKHGCGRIRAGGTYWVVLPWAIGALLEVHEWKVGREIAAREQIVYGVIVAHEPANSLALALTRNSSTYGTIARGHKGCGRATIEAHYSEVRLEPYRETDGDGQGSGLSGEAESQFAGLRFARLAAAD